MRNLVYSRAARWYTAGAVAVTAAAVQVAGAFASSYDLSQVATPVTSQVQEALTVGLPIMGSLLALGIGIRWVKRFFHA